MLLFMVLQLEKSASLSSAKLEKQSMYISVSGHFCDFLFAALSKMGQILNSILYKLILIEKRFASPESASC